MAGSIGAYVELMRPKNLVLAGATVPLEAYFALMSDVEPFPLGRGTPRLCRVFFTGAGNAMNDIKDADIDRTAHPQRPLPSERLTPEQARGFTTLCFAGLSLRTCWWLTGR